MSASDSESGDGCAHARLGDPIRPAIYPRSGGYQVGGKPQQDHNFLQFGSIAHGRGHELDSEVSGNPP